MRQKYDNVYSSEGNPAKEKKNMAKLIIECNTNREAFELLTNLIYTINEAKHKAFKDYLDAMDRREFDKADFYGNEYKKCMALRKQITNFARVEF